MITLYVNTASTAGGDGTTNNTTGATRAFASLHEAMDSLPNMTELSDATTIYCEGTAADTTALVSADWYSYTTAAKYLRIVGNNTSGLYSTSAYRLEVTDDQAIYNQYLSHVRLENLQVKITVTTSGQIYNGYRLATGNNNGAVDHRITNCIVQKAGVGTSQVFGFRQSDPASQGGTCVIKNCVAFGGCYAGYDGDSSAWSTAYLKNVNCTGYGNQYNYMDTQICINCLSAAPTVGSGFAGTGTSGHLNNVSDDSSAGGTNSHINHTFTFVDAGAGDLHLDAADAGARGFGIGPASNGDVLTTDIDGTARSGATCDVGADEYAAGGGVNVPLTGVCG
jgi:hypothetical protein